MNQQTKAQAIYADMVRQAGDAVEDLRVLHTDLHYLPPERASKLYDAIETLGILTAFIQGIQVTQGLMHNPRQQGTREIFEKMYGPCDCSACTEKRVMEKESYVRTSDKENCEWSGNCVFETMYGSCNDCMKKDFTELKGKTTILPNTSDIAKKVLQEEGEDYIEGCTCEVCKRVKVQLEEYQKRARNIKAAVEGA